jgi:cytochrome P450
MQLMGLPASDTDQFLQWEFDLLHNLDLAVKAEAAAAIREYLLQLMHERRSQPSDDLATLIVQARLEDRLLNDDEVLGVYYLMFVGGLDTVAASLGLYFNYLAQHPELQSRLRSEPAQIPRAVEEFVRAFSPVTTRRIVTQDCELAGVAMKAGDWVTCVTALASLDPDEYPNPLEVELERPHPRHFGFSMGPHFCIGMHLARREIAVALEGWLNRVPPFRLKPGFEARMHGGPVIGLDTLELEWA